MILWQRWARKAWVEKNESLLQEMVGPNLAIVSRPGRARLLVQVTCKRQTLADQLLRDFGGKSEPIPGDWWNSFADASVHPPIRIGRRLEIVSASNEIAFLDGLKARRPSQTGSLTSRKRSAGSPRETESGTGIPRLVIPAAGAFGTGEHATTAMSLRLLEETTRKLRKGWRLLDAGTGSGILALAARTLGASAVIGLDNDPRAVANARYNARLNRIAHAKFVLADVARFKSAERYEVVAANLFSELLISVLPVFRRALKARGRLIVSGILREQARSVLAALQRAGFELEKKRRRGKWIALSLFCHRKVGAARRGTSPRQGVFSR